ncbi:MAG: hypothetical protein CMH83_14325 [Nocardioides sp.]|nr:hypothetical protein [Nocardioides sp.]
MTALPTDAARAAEAAAPLTPADADPESLTASLWDAARLGLVAPRPDDTDTLVQALFDRVFGEASREPGARAALVDDLRSLLDAHEAAPPRPRVVPDRPVWELGAMDEAAYVVARSRWAMATRALAASESLVAAAQEEAVWQGGHTAPVERLLDRARQVTTT